MKNYIFISSTIITCCVPQVTIANPTYMYGTYSDTNTESDDVNLYSSTPYFDKQLKAMEKVNKKRQQKSISSTISYPMATYDTIAPTHQMPESDYRTSSEIKQKAFSQLLSTPQKSATNQITGPTLGKDVLVYTSDPNDPKTYGRKIRVEYFKDWSAQPGISPHNLYKFRDTKYDNALSGRSCLINIIDVGENMSQTQWKFALSDPDTALALHDLYGNLLHFRATQADSLPAMMILSETEQEQIGIKMYAKMLTVSAGYKNTLITMQCVAMDDNKANANNLFDKSKSAFLRFMNSFKCLDRWEQPETTFSETDDIMDKIQSEFKHLLQNDNKKNIENLKDTIKVFSSNADYDYACVNTQDDIDRIRNNPEVVVAVAVMSYYNRFTQHIQDYCADYTVPYNFINRTKTKLFPYKQTAENKIKTIMGADYFKCITNELQSDDEKLLLFFFIDVLRQQIEVGTKDFCRVINYDSVIHNVLTTTINQFKALGF